MFSFFILYYERNIINTDIKLSYSFPVNYIYSVKIVYNLLIRKIMVYV